MAHVELICGPAGSGKTSRLRKLYREEIVTSQADGHFGSSLWITPSKRSRSEILRTLVGDDPAVCFSPQVVTFDEFAERLLVSAPDAVRPLSGIARRRLLRELIDDLHRQRQLSYFGNVAAMPGFLDLCESFIAELKREEVWPEDFEHACEKAHTGDGPTLRPKTRELALIYRTYQARLHAAGTQVADRDGLSGLYDSEGRFWSARTLINRGHRGPFRDVKFIVVDGFTDFTRLQREMLAGLAGWAERMFVTLPLDEAGRREELFTKSSVALHDLKQSFAGHDVTVTPTALTDAAKATPRGRISSSLFDNPRELPRSSDATGIAVLSCIRPSGEIEAVTRRIKQMLVDGTVPDEIIVAFRTLDGLADTLREAFAEAGIPAAVDVGPAIASTGVVRFLFALLELEREDWAFPQLMGVLNSTLFRPDWPGIEDGTAACAVAACLRRLDLESGRDVILSALNRRTAAGSSETETDVEADPAMKTALDVLRRLSKTTASLRQKAGFATWVDRILHLAATLRIVPDRKEAECDPGGLASRERRGWDAFVRLLEESRKANPVAGVKEPHLNLTEFRRQITELLANQRLKCDVAETGRVRVLSADQVRNLDVPHLFLCGLSESSFPQSRGDDCLYGDAERLKLSDHGVPLGHRTRRSREEMLLFYGVVTRYRKSLTLSYPCVDDDGEPMYRSPFVTSFLGLFEPEAVKIEDCGRFDPVPATRDECVTEADVRIRATREALAGQADLFAALAARNTSEQTARNIVAAADMATARFRTRGLTNYEGVLSDPRNRKRLRRRFSPKHEFSATELETYAAHPFRYFLRYVLGLEAPAIPGPGTDFARRGRVLHTALASLHEELSSATIEISTETLIERLQDAIGAATSVGGDSPLQRVLRQIERDGLLKHATRYGVQWEEYLKLLAECWDSLPRPVHFETPFGNMPEEERPPETAVNPRVAFGRDGEVVYVRGQIDRIDVGHCDGQPVFIVIDYKHSKSPKRFSLEDLELGLALQLAIYAVAAQRLRLVEAELYQLGFWSLTGKGFVCGFKGRQKGIVSLDAEQVTGLEASLDGVIPQLAESIRSGWFPIVPEDPDAKYNPDVVAVARAAQFGSVADLLGKLRAGFGTFSRTREATETGNGVLLPGE